MHSFMKTSLQVRILRQTLGLSNLQVTASSDPQCLSHGKLQSLSIECLTACAVLQAALTNRITSRARLEEVGRCVIAANTDKLFEVGLDEHMVRQMDASNALSMLYTLYG